MCEAANPPLTLDNGVKEQHKHFTIYNLFRWKIVKILKLIFPKWNALLKMKESIVRTKKFKPSNTAKNMDTSTTNDHSSKWDISNSHQISWKPNWINKTLR